MLAGSTSTVRWDAPHTKQSSFLSTTIVDPWVPSIPLYLIMSIGGRTRGEKVQTALERGRSGLHVPVNRTKRGWA